MIFISMISWISMMSLLISGASSLGVCPSECDCSLDVRGRRQVKCEKGGMVNPIPIAKMDTQIEVLRISAPPLRLNALTIGPIFQQFSRLEELHITQSNVPTIGMHSFWGVPTLRILNLSDNNITHVLDYNFRGLADLNTLILDDNRIESIPSGTFHYLSELRVLSLARNRLSKLEPRLFLKLGKLAELDLSFNRLGDLNPEVFKDVQSLRVLRCRGCALANMNTLVYRLLPDLSLLDLGDNEFKYVAADEFRDLRRLRTLYLDGNQLPVVLEGSFQAQQRHLETLSLARNRLAKVTTAAFLGLVTLRTLDISWNKLDKLEAASFLPLAESLRSLDLAGNSLTVENIHYVLQELPHLQNLSLAHMHLSELPPLAGMQHLVSLNLSGNRLSHLPPPPPPLLPLKLEALDLSQNLLRGLDERQIPRLAILRTLNVAGNPWVCDLCHASSLLRLRNASGLLCALPASLRGRSVASLTQDQLVACGVVGGGGYLEADGGVDAAGVLIGDESRLGFIAVGGAVLLLLLTGALLLAGLAYTRYHAAHYYTREESRTPGAEVGVFENPGALLGHSNGDIKYTLVTSEKLGGIATISKDADLRTLSNGT